MHRHNATVEQIIKAHLWKRHYERYFPVSRFLFRPAGFIANWLSIRRGLTSEMVSWMSAVVGLIGCAFLINGNVYFMHSAVGFLLIF